jgi:selenide,water dikinase
VLGADGYAAMIANTTKLNKPGKALADMAGVHALTDVTGFGLLGHLLELARGAKLSAELDMGSIPLLPGVEQLAHDGFFTGASGRNWDAYGHDVVLDPAITPAQRALLTDPQTSGGLLVSCAPDSVDEVLALFARGGFGHAAVIGRMRDGEPKVSVRA